MYRVTRKQMIRHAGNCIECEHSVQADTLEKAESIKHQVFTAECLFGGQPYGPNKVIFETSSFYRSVTVTIEEVK